MDAVEFLKTHTRMCVACRDFLCDDCPFHEKADGMCQHWAFKCPEEAVALVERWAEQHPVKTRQSEFLKQWPNARRYPSGVLSVCPKGLDSNLNLDCSRHCGECCSRFWLVEVE